MEDAGFQCRAGVGQALAEVDRVGMGEEVGPVLRSDLIERATLLMVEGSVRGEPARCGSAWKRDPGSGVIGVEKGPLIPVV